MSFDTERLRRQSWKMFDQIASTYDFINSILSLGMDRHWRQKLLSCLPRKNNLEVLDLATGTGEMALLLAQEERVKRVVGLDLAEKMLERGRDKVAKKNLQGKVQLLAGDGVEIPCEKASFDVVTVVFGIRNFGQVQQSLGSMHRVLRPGGRVIIMEFSLPNRKICQWPYLFYLRHILPHLGNYCSGHNHAYSYLKETISHFPYGESFLAHMAQANFSGLEKKELALGATTLYWGDKRG